jgi:hypothetical protein
LTKYLDSFSFYNDTLSLNFTDTTKISYSKLFNKTKNKFDSIPMMVFSSSSQCWGGYDVQRFQYKLKGFNKLPYIIQFNHGALSDCPIKPLKFQIYNNDSINIIDKNGQKDGLWIYFYDTGEVKTKKLYTKEGVNGYEYEKNGEIKYYIIGEDCSGDIIEFKFKKD